MVNSGTFNLQAPRPPSFEESSDHPNRTLLWIQDRISEIYTIGKPDQQPQDNASTSMPITEHAAYLNIYNAVNSYILAVKAAESQPASHRRSALSGGEIYLSLESAIRNSCQESLIHANTAPDVLSAYMERWGTFMEVSRRVNKLFQFLERHWINRVIDEKRKDVYLLQDLHMRIWREEVLGVGSEKIVDALVRNTYEGQSELGSDDQKLRDDCAASLSQVGLILSNGSLVALKS